MYSLFKFQQQTTHQTNYIFIFRTILLSFPSLKAPPHYCLSNKNRMAEVAAKERKILVAVDEGEESMYALSWCLKNVISKDTKDTLILLYSKAPRAVYSALDGTGYLFSADIMASMDKYSNDVAACIIEKAKRICREQADEVKVEARVESGDPRDVICQVADQIHADVLVLGSHGYGLIKRAFLGSVSNHCAQNVKCPVLIVKKPKCSSSGAK